MMPYMGILGIVTNLLLTILVFETSFLSLFVSHSARTAAQI